MSNYSTEERNNRQLILWGEDGQAAVDNARVVVLGSDCVASEFLKNIVLHGFGNVTIIDNAIVNEEDLKSNFLVDAADLGKPRAESIANLLRELNEEIKVQAKNQNPEDLSFINEDPKPGFVITCGNLKPSFLIELNRICREKHIPQGHIQSSGLFGAFYLDAGLHEIYEGPYNGTLLCECRAKEPFPKLAEYFNSFSYEDPHFPSPAIFYRAITNLKNEGKSSPDSDEIKKEIYKIQGSNQRVCFIEALQKVGTFKMQVIPLNTKDVFQIANKHSENKEPFWEIARAASRFTQTHKILPHYGGCPDLETSSEIYLKLKQIYAEKSKEDWDEIRKDLAEHNANVDEKTLAHFAKNILRIDAVDYHPLSHCINFVSSSNNENGDVTVQCLFVAVRNFYEKNNRQPQNTKEDQDALIAEIKQLGSKYVGDDEVVADYVKEYTSAKGHIIPSVAATIGAIFAQEVTKIVIHQAKPVKGAFIYNAVKCSGKTFD